MKGFPGGLAIRTQNFHCQGFRFNPWSRNKGFLGGSVVKKSACNEGDARDSGLTLVGKTSPPGEGNGSPLQYACLENPMDRGAWRAAVIGLPRARHDRACTCKELRPTEIPQTAALGQKKIVHVEARETAPSANATSSA